MDLQTLITILKKEKPMLAEKYGVEEMAVFGSYARNEQTDDSDIDLLIKLREPRLKYWAGAYTCLENLLKKKIDLVTTAAYISRGFRQYMEKDLIYV
jgi:hypothetical protein